MNVKERDFVLNRVVRGLGCMLAAATLLCGFSGRAATAAEVRDDAEAFNLATFNVRTAADKGVNSWGKRLPRVAQVVRSRGFDVFGVQEARPWQRDGLLSQLPGWAAVGEAGKKGKKGEGVYIFFATNRFTCVKSDTFWLSTTPRKRYSKSWGSMYVRICTVAVLRDLRTGRTLRYYNTHLDPGSDLARKEGMKLILSDIGACGPKDAVVLTGDLNTSNLADILPENAPLKDSFLISETPREGPENTFNAWRNEAVSRIDFVLVSNGLRVLRYITCNDRPGGKLPSDHDAVVTRLKFR